MSRFLINKTQTECLSFKFGVPNTICIKTLLFLKFAPRLLPFLIHPSHFEIHLFFFMSFFCGMAYLISPPSFSFQILSWVFSALALIKLFSACKYIYGDSQICWQTYFNHLQFLIPIKYSFLILYTKKNMLQSNF